MSLFGKKTSYPDMPKGNYEPVLRCSICSGEEVLCAKDRETGELRDIMLIVDDRDLIGFCRQNGIAPGTIKKVY